MHDSTAIPDQTKPFTFPETALDGSPYAHKIVFTADDFASLAAVPDADASTNYKYDIVLTIKDLVSTLPEKTYTITVTVTNENHKPYLKTDSDTDLGTWVIGHKPVTMPTIASTLWTDDDPSDTVAFKASTIANCAIT